MSSTNARRLNGVAGLGYWFVNPRIMLKKNYIDYKKFDYEKIPSLHTPGFGSQRIRQSKYQNIKGICLFWI